MRGRDARGERAFACRSSQSRWIVRFDSIRFDSIRFVRTMVSSVAHNRSTRVVSHRARERPSRSAGPRFRKRRALDASERAPDLHASDARRLSRGRWRSAALSQATNRDGAAPEQSHLARLARFSRPRDARKDVEQPITLRIDSGRAILYPKSVRDRHTTRAPRGAHAHPPILPPRHLLSSPFRSR